MKHLGYLKTINVVLGWLCIAAGVLGGGAPLMMALLAPTTEGTSSPVLLLVLVAVGVIAICTLIGVVTILTGHRVAEGRWRIVQTILAILQVTNLPLGTAYGLYAFWICWMNEETKALFR